MKWISDAYILGAIFYACSRSGKPAIQAFPGLAITGAIAATGWALSAGFVV